MERSYQTKTNTKQQKGAPVLSAPKVYFYAVFLIRERSAIFSIPKSLLKKLTIALQILAKKESSSAESVAAQTA